MSNEKRSAGGVEWRITLEDGSLSILVPKAGPVTRVLLGLKGLIIGLIMKVGRFLEKAWDLGVDDPGKVIHCLKVGIALTVVSLFYYMRPLYEGVGGNAMWAVMTVVVVFENNVGATIYKCLNRVFGTSLAACLGFGVHWLAHQSGERFEPLIVGASVFLLASAATFSRFMPTVKARFDYGAMIFILTFSLVTLSGYRVDKLFDMAHERLSTIIIGISICIFVSVLICPIWAGHELHVLIYSNMDKLASSLDGCVAEYFDRDGESADSNEESDKNLLGYKCVLGSKASEESKANFARWEPAHGRFNFKHPWKQYLKIGASMRSCAYCIEALNGCIDSENQAPEFIKKRMSAICLRVSSNSSSVIRELAKAIKTMKKTTATDFSVQEMSNAVQELQNDLTSMSGLLSPPELSLAESKVTETTSQDTAAIPLLEVIPVVTLASLLIEIASRVEAIVGEVEKLSKLAEFKSVVIHDNSRQNQPANHKIVPDQIKDEGTMKSLQRVGVSKSVFP